MKLVKVEDCHDADNKREKVEYNVVLEECDTNSIVSQLQKYFDDNGSIPEYLEIVLKDEEGEDHKVELDNNDITKYIENLNIDSTYLGYSINDRFISEDEIIEKHEKFESLYDRSIKYISQIPVGTIIHGMWSGPCRVTSEPFVDKGEIGAWVQVEVVKDPNDKEFPTNGYKLMVPLGTYGISFCGTHNLLFLDNKDCKEYKSIDWQIGSSFEVDFDGPSRCPIWIKHCGRGADEIMSKSDYDALPRRSYDIISNEFNG